MLRKRVTSLTLYLLVILMQFSILLGSPIPPNDYSNHWAGREITQAVEEGILQGYPDGNVKPDVKITRAEFFQLINNSFGFDEVGEISFRDVPKDAWYRLAVEKAYAAGYITGYTDGSIRPENPISRQEVAMITGELATFSTIEQAANFTDQSEIPNWSLEAVVKVNQAGIMTGYEDGSFKPEAHITRSEAVVTLTRLLDKAPLEYSVDGVFGPEEGTKIIHRDTYIRAQSIELRNLHIKGDLIITEDVGDGDVYLRNVQVEGRTIVRGGGSSSIHIDGGSYQSIIIEQTSATTTRIVGINTEGLFVVITDQAQGEEIILEGDFAEVRIEANQVNLKLQGEGTVESLVVAKEIEGSKVHFEEATTVKALTIDSPAEINGQGIVEHAQVNANDVTFEKQPTELAVSPEVEIQPIVAQPKPTQPQTPIPPQEPIGGDTGGGNPIENPTILVSSITITTQNVTIPVKSELQFTAEINPSNATDKRIRWSVINGSGSATISETGLMNGATVGTVTVKAEALDGSGTFVTKDINISALQTLAGHINHNTWLEVEGTVKSDIRIQYRTIEDYDNGSVTFKLPEGFSIQDGDDVLLVSSPYIRIGQTTDKRFELSQDRQTLTVFDIMFTYARELMLILRDAVIPSAGNYQFSVSGDKDGENATYLPTAGVGEEAFEIVSAKGYILSGTISLPEGRVAESGGVPVRVGASGNNWYSTEVVIPEGDNSVTYQIRIPSDNYEVSAVLNNNDDYVSTLYYSQDGAGQPGTKVVVNDTGVSGVDIELLVGRTINGTISLPEGIVSPSRPTYVYLYAEGVTTHQIIIPIATGANSANYSLRVPEGTYKIRLWIPEGGYISNLYYASASPVFTKADASEIVLTDQDVTGLNVTLIKGGSITGNFSLPQGYVSPAEAMYVYVTAEGSQSFSDSFFLNAGDSSGTYTITLPVGTYKLKYSFNLQGESPFEPSMYYSETGNVKNSIEASAIEVGNEDLVVNLEVSLKKFISGIVKLPVGMVAPDGGIEYRITVTTNQRVLYTVVQIISSGENSAPYAIYVPSGEVGEYYVRCFIVNEIETPLISGIYYNENESVFTESEASLVEVANSSISNIDFSFVEGNCIIGNFALPNDEVAPVGGQQVNITAYLPDWDTFSTMIIIPEGQNNANYRISVPNGEYNLTARVDFNPLQPYIMYIAYNESGTVLSDGDRTVFTVSDEDVHNINFIAIKGLKITGTLIVPVNTTIPDGGYYIHAQAFDLSTDHSFSFSTKLTPGNNNFPYTINLPSGKYAVAYHLSSDTTPFIRMLYYSGSGMVETSAEATVITVGNFDVVGIDLALELKPIS